MRGPKLPISIVSFHRDLLFLKRLELPELNQERGESWSGVSSSVGVRSRPGPGNGDSPKMPPRRQWPSTEKKMLLRMTSVFPAELPPPVGVFRIGLPLFPPGPPVRPNIHNRIDILPLSKSSSISLGPAVGISPESRNLPRLMKCFARVVFKPLG